MINLIVFCSVSTEATRGRTRGALASPALEVWYTISLKMVVGQRQWRSYSFNHGGLSSTTYTAWRWGKETYDELSPVHTSCECESNFDSPCRKCFAGVEHISTVAIYSLRVCDVEICRKYEPGFREFSWVSNTHESMIELQLTSSIGAFGSYR